MQANIAGYQIKIQGIVQGVGFRPHVYRLAHEYELNGWVLNSSAGVLIEAEGNAENLNQFAHRLVADPPPMAVIRSCQITPIEPLGFNDFTIRKSDNQEEKTVMISPDIAICPDCKREVLNPQDRRFGYPFTNCTNCGPRFTIIKDVPYDRAMTTMAPFVMCPTCQKEYDNPMHRRFHAQPNACPVCGPHTSLLNRQGEVVEETPVDLLKRGYIVAVKGLGGFHLAVDATNAQAVKTLRGRKQRDAKPFAVMARDLEAAHRCCIISEVEEKWLTSPQAPIVVLAAKKDSKLPREVIHPGISTLGVMLPYTPLHYLLFDQDLEILIMTSANISDDPLITGNNEALEKLADIADFFLVHNREIYNPCDDSVMRVTALNTPQYMRRARGFVPQGIKMPVNSEPVLAVGGEMKNTFCITRQGEAFLSQHWGDLNHYRNYSNFLQGIERFKAMLAVEPKIIAHDLHPDYQNTRWAKNQAGSKIIGIQHHYAHMASAMADNGLEDEVLGLVCDGTGWGTDGAVWGCEVLRGDYRQFSRLAHLKYMPLPGGDVTARKPYRMALVYLMTVLGEEGLSVARKYLPELTPQEMEIMAGSIQKETSRELQTSSCGRLFDAVSALLGVCSVNKYEGQAAIELEERSDPNQLGSYSYNYYKEQNIWIMDVFPMWHQLVGELKEGRPVSSMAQKFHLTLIQMFSAILERLRNETGINRVVLSGGVFHNQILLAGLIKNLTSRDFSVYQHQQVPPGDGGISLGQAIIASEVDT
ncbi:MAG TPA: carbamoyltransferase HypF [Syntrophomonadaceae bacterium]|nr:carbamoyltransferase HypF [Syntrophomonadaceae bacterium]